MNLKIPFFGVVFCFFLTNCFGQKPIIKSITYLPTFDRVYDIKNTIEKGTILLCYNSIPFISGTCTNTDYALVKLDSNGVLLWKKCVPKPVNGVFNNIISNSDSTIFLFGTRLGLSNSVIEKYDKNGNVIFTKQLVSGYQFGYNNHAISNIEVKNNFIYVFNQASSPSTNYLLQKYDFSGNLVSQSPLINDYYFSGAYQKNSYLTIRNNGDVLLFTFKDGASPINRLQCFDSNFNLIWTKEFDQSSINSMIEVGNSDIFLATTSKLRRLNSLGELIEEKDIYYNSFEVEYGYNPSVLNKDFDGNALFYEKIYFPQAFVKISKINNLTSSIWERSIYGNIFLLQFLPKLSGGYLGLFRKNYLDIDGFSTDNLNKTGIISFLEEYKCPELINFTNSSMFFFKNIYNSLNSTELQASFKSGSISEFKSEKQLILLPGLSIEKGSVFKAEIINCNN